jgi:hypothetical protein
MVHVKRLLELKNVPLNGSRSWSATLGALASSKGLIEVVIESN